MPRLINPKDIFAYIISMFASIIINSTHKLPQLLHPFIKLIGTLINPFDECFVAISMLRYECFLLLALFTLLPQLFQ